MYFQFAGLYVIPDSFRYASKRRSGLVRILQQLCALKIFV
jgi:hypothetical protein